MNNYLTHWQIPRQSVSGALGLKEGSLSLGKTFKVFLQFSSLVMALLCVSTQSSYAQIPASCGTSKLYYYDLNGNISGLPVVPKLTGGTMDGVLLAQAITNSSALGKFVGSPGGGLGNYLVFETAAGHEYYSALTGAFVGPVRPKVFSPMKATPANGTTTTTHAGESIDKTNPNWIDIASYWAVLKDADGSLSMYDYTSGKYLPTATYDPTWTTFTGGSLAGLSPSRHSPSNPTGTIDGIEFNIIFHMNPAGNGGNGSLEFYNYQTGAYVADVSTDGTLNGGRLNNVPLKDALANGLDGALPTPNADVTYLGISGQSGRYYMNFYDATANRVLIYDASFLFPPTNTFAAFEPTALTPNILTPAPNITTLADILSPKFVGVGSTLTTNALWFKDASGKFEAYQGNSPAGTGLYETPHCFDKWDGPHAGEAIGHECMNPNLISMVESTGYVMKDSDGTISYYQLDGFGNVS